MNRIFGTTVFIVIRNIVVIAGGGYALGVGLTALTGYGLDKPSLYEFAGSKLSLISATLSVAMGLALLFTGLSWLEAYHLGNHHDGKKDK